MRGTGARPAGCAIVPARASGGAGNPAPVPRPPGGPPRRPAVSCPPCPGSTCAPTPSPTPPRRCAEPWPTAELGDDVFGDDPTVNALEERAAELLGKEAGLFVASGTMGNLVAQLAHLARGSEIVAAASSHLVMDEAAGHAVVVGRVRAHARRERRRDDRSGGYRGGVPRSRRPPRADDGAHRAGEHARPLDGPPAHRRLRGGRRGRRPRQPRPAPPRRGPLLQRRRGARRQPGRPRRSRRLGHVLPLEGPRLPGRLRRRRQPGLHRARPPRPEAPRRRDAPGRHPGRRRPRRAVRRSRRDDRAPGRGPRQRPPARRGPRRPRRRRIAGRASPSRRRAASTPIGRHGLRHLPRRPRPRGVPRRPGGAGRADGPVPPRHGPRRDPLRRSDAIDVDATIAAVRDALAETAGTRPTAGAEAVAATGAWAAPVRAATAHG